MKRLLLRHITYDDCAKFMQEHQGITRTELRKNYRIYYERMTRQGWIDELAPIPRYITEDRVKTAIAKCKYLLDFQNNYRSEYCWVMEHKRTDLLVGLKRKAGLQKRGIYAYEFDDHSVYIGLTWNFESRDERHREKERNSAVYVYSQKSGCSIPQIKILVPIELTPDTASIAEGEWVEKYRNDGWKIINRAKTGGLGGTHNFKPRYTKEELAEIVKPYTCRKQLSKNNYWAYNYGMQMGWLDELLPPKAKNKHTKNKGL